MNEYYGVASTPTEDFLAHYGIRGMKWGVRKSIADGNGRRLNRHYNAAVRRLQKLTARSDKELVNQAKKQNARNTIANTLAGGAGSGLMTYAINSHLPTPTRLKVAGIVGGAMAGVNALSGGIQQGMLSRWGSKKGNAKQVAKRNEWEREMRNAFKGTKYANKIDSAKVGIKRNIENIKNDFNPARMTNGASKSKRRGYKQKNSQYRRY